LLGALPSSKQLAEAPVQPVLRLPRDGFHRLTQARLAPAECPEHGRAVPFFQAALQGQPTPDLAQRAGLAAGISLFNTGSYEKALASFEALRGVALVSAVTIVAEVGTLSRFTRPPQLMGYGGLGPREASSGARTWRGGITKTGHAHLRRIVVEAAWAYRHRPAVIGALRRRQAGLSEPVKAIAWKAQHRLHGRFRKLLGRGKSRPQAATAVGRELLGFIWAIGVAVEAEHRQAHTGAA
jgi:transposase